MHPLHMPRRPHHGAAYTAREELLHAASHGVGLVASLAGLVVLVAYAAAHGDGRHVAGTGVFGATLVLLYAASTAYHGARSEGLKRTLRLLDHAAIYLLIAGTYTPFALVSLEGPAGWTLLAVIWGLALGGVASEMALPHLARRLSLPLYLGMGWLAVVALEPLAGVLGRGGVALLVAGGLAYSAGVVFYVWRRLPYNHAVWHGFVLAGSGLHFSCVLGFVVPGAD